MKFVPGIRFVPVQFRFVEGEQSLQLEDGESFPFATSTTKVHWYFDQRNVFPRFGNRLTAAQTAVTALSCSNREIERKETDAIKKEHVNRNVRPTQN